MNLRDFLDAREQELLREIADLHQQLTPKEAELAEIRRAKGAIGIAALAAAGGPHLADALQKFRDVDPLKRLRDERSLAHVLAFGGSANTPLPLPASPYGNLTMKQLIVKVLIEHFKDGATARQMIDFFRDAWGRNIERQNLSPQISRLYQEGTIGRVRSSRGWFHYTNEGHVVGFRPYLHQERIVWWDPIATDLNYEPLVAKEIEVEVANDRAPFKRTIATVRNGVTSRQVRLVWLLPHEVTGDDEPASWHETPPAENEED